MAVIWEPERGQFECVKCGEELSFPAGATFREIKQALEDHGCTPTALFEKGRTGELIAV
jgi:hypothetical protein